MPPCLRHDARHGLLGAASAHHDLRRHNRRAREPRGPTTSIHKSSARRNSTARPGNSPANPDRK